MSSPGLTLPGLPLFGCGEHGLRSGSGACPRERRCIRWCASSSVLVEQEGARPPSRGSGGASWFRYRRGGSDRLYTAVALARRGHGHGDRPGSGAGRRLVVGPQGRDAVPSPALFPSAGDRCAAGGDARVSDGLLAAGAVQAVLPGRPACQPGCAAAALPSSGCCERPPGRAGVRLRTGHVDAVCGERGRVTGVRVGGRQVDAGLVIDAGGRGGRLTRALRGPAEGGDCGIAYVSRQYQMLPGAAAGSVNVPFGVVMNYPGYLAAAFLHDNPIISVLIARASADRQLAALRTQAAFEAATRAVPALAAWTGPGQARPLTPVLPGGRLYNSYRGQLDDAGRVALAGLIYAGDAVCTTNPSAGRGVTTSLRQARQLIALLGEHGRDLRRPARWRSTSGASATSSPGSTTMSTGTRICPALVRPGRQPDPAAPAGPDHGRRASRPGDSQGRRALPGHARAARQPGRRPGPGPGPLRDRLAPARAARPGPGRTGRPRRRGGHLPEPPAQDAALSAAAAPRQPGHDQATSRTGRAAAVTGA